MSAARMIDTAMVRRDLTRGHVDRYRIVLAARDYVHALQAEREAEDAQRALDSESLRTTPDVTQDQIDEAGERVRAARLATLAALAVLENEVDR